jgi:two-component system chemotaxis response regulator CheY
MVSSVVSSLHPDWTVLVAPGGAEALALVENRTPDVAILDYNMPGMDGLELARHLRVQFPTLPMGFLTANVQDSLRKKAEALGCGFIPKPITTDKIRAFLAEAGL